MNNTVEVVGVISCFTKENNIKIRKEDLYKSYIKIRRESGIYDVFPIIINRLYYSCFRNFENKRVHIIGRFSSYNFHENDNNKLMLYLYIEDIDLTDSLLDINNIKLDGYICKPTIIRETPNGRIITDILLAVNSKDNHSDYIPCICWGNNAKLVSKLSVSSKLLLSGRIQSRTYNKLKDNCCQEKVAYEISVNSVNVYEK